ncbi:MAG: type II toxin-antitoxin system VapB family antitoxin [Sphingomicrobium sp.]
MSRYHALAEHLKRLPQPNWDARFDDIERVLGGPLPKSAYRYPAWWANQAGPGHSQTLGWKSAGWRTAKLDLGRQRVRFERHEPATDHQSGSDEQGEAALLSEAQRWTGIADRSSLIRESLRALIAREAARRLARLGGAMPGFEAPPRDRSGR